MCVCYFLHLFVCISAIADLLKQQLLMSWILKRTLICQVSTIPVSLVLANRTGHCTGFHTSAIHSAQWWELVPGCGLVAVLTSWPCKKHNYHPFLSLRTNDNFQSTSLPTFGLPMRSSMRTKQHGHTTVLWSACTHPLDCYNATNHALTISLYRQHGKSWWLCFRSV